MIFEGKETPHALHIFLPLRTLNWMRQQDNPFLAKYVSKKMYLTCYFPTSSQEKVKLDSVLELTPCCVSHPS